MSNQPKEVRQLGKSGKELQKKVLPPLVWTVDDLVPSGLITLAGKPKIGKSWLMLDLALSVAEGNPFLGKATARGNVLYLAFEDGEGRMQRRIKKLVGEQELGDRFEYDKCSTLDNGGDEELQGWLDAHPEARLIIIDTLDYIRPEGSTKQNQYSNDRRFMSILQQLADKSRITIIVVNHMRKQGADDIHDQQIGTTAITGTADAFVTIDRIRGQHDAVWHVTGRELEEMELAIRFNKEICKWEMLGETKQVLGKSKAEIIGAIQSAGKPMTASELSTILNRDGGTLRSTMSRMAREGLLLKTGEGYVVEE